jgi:hypothetical protein
MIILLLRSSLAFINLNHFKENVQFVDQEQGFVTQLGTVFIKKDHFGNKLLEPTPIYKDGEFFNSQNEKFVIVHQYDRNPQIKEIIYKKYQ